MRYDSNKNNAGFLLIPAILILSLLLIIGLYFLTFTTGGKKISESYSISQQAYYLAESGIEYAIWKLKNDLGWQTSFETDPNWTQTYTGGSALFPNGSFDILIKNYGLAKADVTATSTLQIGGRRAQRVIKTKIFKALGESTINNNAVFADKDIEIWASGIDVNNGSIFANDDLMVTLGSEVDVQDKAQAVDDIDVSLWSTLNATGGIYDENNPPAPAPIEMPSVDFDSWDPNSFKSLAQAQGQYYTNPEFRDLLDDNPTLVLNGVVYVTGNIDIETDHNLTINGVLATNGKIDVGYNKHWWELCPSNSAVLTIGHIEGQPSGIFTKNNIKFKECVNTVNINGIVYASNSINLNNRYCADFTIDGSVLARDISAFVLTNGIIINYNEQAVVDTLGGSGFSPVITVEYWEEEY